MARRQIPQHFTASGVVIEDGHILLIHHKRIGAWLPPGGHIDEFEMPHECALREIFEETGVEAALHRQSVPPGIGDEAFFLPSPLCFHAVTAVEKGVELYHLDLVYLCRPLTAEPGLPRIKTCDEVHEARWVPLAELRSLTLARNVQEAVEIALLKLSSLS